jgi:hypothetical protein
LVEPSFAYYIYKLSSGDRKAAEMDNDLLESLASQWFNKVGLDEDIDLVASISHQAAQEELAEHANDIGDEDEKEDGDVAGWDEEIDGEECLRAEIRRLNEEKPFRIGMPVVSRSICSQLKFKSLHLYNTTTQRIDKCILAVVQCHAK